MKRFGIISICSVLLTTCGGESAYYSAAKGTLSRENAGILANLIAQRVQWTFTEVTAEVTGGFDNNVSPYSECRTQEPTNTENSDGDEIIKTRVVTFTCQDLGEFKAFFKGSFTESDLDDASTTAGFRYDIDINEGRAAGEAPSDSTNVGYVHLRKTSEAQWTLNTNITKNHVTTTSSGALTVAGGQTLEYLITPDDSNAPVAAGTVEMSGYYALKQATEGDVSTRTYDFVLKGSSSGLRYQDASTCTWNYSAGTITWEDGDGNRFEMTFTCDAFTKTYNGEALD